MKIVIETLIRKQIPLDINENMKIIDIKTKIQEIEKINVDCQRLNYNGQELDDEFVIKDYSIQENSIIELVIKLGYIIFIETPEKKQIKLEPKPIQLIKSIKEKIELKEGISQKDQKLFYNNEELEDDKRLLDYNIDNRSIIHLSFS